MSPELPRYSPDPTLTAEQHHVLALLAEGRSLAEAAAQSGVHRNTVRNWRRTVPAFARECELAIREQALVWHEYAVDLAPRAAAVLHEILHDPATPPALRLRAALAVLNTAANPQPKALPLLHSFGAEMEAARGRYLTRHSEPVPAEPPTDVHVQDLKSRTILHNRTATRAPELGRNAPCFCGSGQKYKRCCAPYAAPRNAVPRSASAMAA